VVGGEFSRPTTFAVALCSMLLACEHVSDVERINDWCRAADRQIRTYGHAFIYADCRMRHGGILLDTGKWAEAESELRGAMELTPAETSFHRDAAAHLAALRLRQGRIDEADALLARIPEHRSARALAAAVRHARGEHAVAAAMLRRCLDRREANPIRAAAVLDLLVDVHLAREDLDGARQTAQRLSEVAAGHGGDLVSAHAAFAAGRVAAAAEDAGAAAQLLERAIEIFDARNLLYEGARARLALARALGADQRDVAALEAGDALATFEKLGAAPDVASATALLRTLDEPRPREAS
jgi:tetratricopeptide (TPR) repeat protein